MNENEPQLPDDVRKALKKSPTFMPRESFYRGVLEKIERKSAKAEEKPAWSWGFPATALATACVLMMVVFITREKKQEQPELFQQKIDKESAIRNESRPAPVPLMMKADGSNGSLDDLAGSKEVQSRLSRSIAEAVGTPSPFEEEDAALRQKLKAKKGAPAKEVDANLLQIRQEIVNNAKKRVEERKTQNDVGGQDRAASVQQARDTVNGPAGQGLEWKGDHSGITTFRTVAVSSREDWEALWRGHTAVMIPPPPVPEIDFDHLMVVGVFSGTTPSAGYGVTILAANTEPGKAGQPLGWTGAGEGCPPLRREDQRSTVIGVVQCLLSMKRIRLPKFFQRISLLQIQRAHHARKRVVRPRSLVCSILKRSITNDHMRPDGSFGRIVVTRNTGFIQEQTRRDHARLT